MRSETSNPNFQLPTLCESFLPPLPQGGHLSLSPAHCSHTWTSSYIAIMDMEIQFLHETFPGRAPSCWWTTSEEWDLGKRHSTPRRRAWYMTGLPKKHLRGPSLLALASGSLLRFGKSWCTIISPKRRPSPFQLPSSVAPHLPVHNPLFPRRPLLLGLFPRTSSWYG